MGKVKVGIERIQSITLRLQGDNLRIDDSSNDGMIICAIKDLKKTIRIIEHAYKGREDLSPAIRGFYGGTINLGYYQTSIRKQVFHGNYIETSHIPTIIKMLKSVKVEKEKYILNKDNLSCLSISDLEYLKQTMRRRKKVLTDNNGYKYIEV